MTSAERLRAELRERYEIIGGDTAVQVDAVHAAITALERAVALLDCESYAFPVLTAALGVLIGGVKLDSQFMQECGLRIVAIARAMKEADYDQN